jgi:hypothetical protein
MRINAYRLRSSGDRDLKADRSLFDPIMKLKVD